MGGKITGVAGKDNLIINGTILTAYADGDAIKFTPAGPVAQMKVSKDGNSIYAMQNSGIACKVQVRLVRGSLDDITLNGYLQQWIADAATFVLLAGSYVKRIGNGKGGVVNEVYQLAAGVVEGIPEGLTNPEGNTEQAVTTYTLLFRNDVRLMQ
jgi:hypothetical protein